MTDNNAKCSQTDGVVELMDFEEMGEATMDIEEDNGINNYSESLELGKAQGKQAFGFGGLRAGSDGFPRWPQATLHDATDCSKCQPNSYNLVPSKEGLLVLAFASFFCKFFHLECNGSRARIWGM
ncbi:hypothetical protein OIU84_011040 [Salix udensis]|uniref:Uncharacterized protein n=1 Tax=Salix udensis TaxID=889485 RepID=A0AAD6JP78_9ROSI|nr:hypothetical protein OIU84_011040 [Salix udensis]